MVKENGKRSLFCVIVKNDWNGWNNAMFLFKQFLAYYWKNDHLASILENTVFHTISSEITSRRRRIFMSTRRDADNVQTYRKYIINLGNHGLFNKIQLDWAYNKLSFIVVAKGKLGNLYFLTVSAVADYPFGTIGNCLGATGLRGPQTEKKFSSSP